MPPWIWMPSLHTRCWQSLAATFAIDAPSERRVSSSAHPTRARSPGARLLDLHEHVGTLVLHGLERADRPAELAPGLGVLHRALHQGLAGADALERGGDGRVLEGAAQRAGARAGRTEHALRLHAHPF